MSSPTIEELRGTARAIWGDDHPMSIPEIAVAASVITGDLCRLARAINEGGSIDSRDIIRELGNLILSAVRWADDANLDPEVCIASAIVAQRAYVKPRR